MMTRDQAALGTLKSFVVPLLICATLVVPFIVLEMVNRRPLNQDFPLVLFTFMSLHSLLIALLLTPVIRRLWVERSLAALKLGHWIGFLLGIFLAYVYVGVVVDQLPCFLGIPNCD